MNIFKDELTTLWDVICPKCKCAVLNKNGKYKNRQRFICCDCGYSFTTYSKSILDSTKLSPEKWDVIIKGIIDNIKLKTITEDTGVSLISISKIRRKVFDALYPLSRFDQVLNKFYYNPFDDSSIFVSTKDKAILYYYRYNDDSAIAFIEFSKHKFISTSYSIMDFNLLMSSINYPNLSFVSFKDIEDVYAVDYIDRLLRFLKQYRGIKKDLLPKYCNFYDFKYNLNEEELTKLIIHQIMVHKKKND